MSSLIDQLQKVDHELDLLSKSSQNARAIEETNELVSELEGPYTSLKESTALRQTLRNLPNEYLVDINMEEKSTIHELVTLLDLIESKWNEIRHEVRQTKEKTSLIEKMTALSKQFSTNSRMMWQTFVNAERVRFEVTDAEISSARIGAKDNSAKVRQFEQYRNQFNEKSKGLPSSPESIADLREVANNLEQLKAQIEWQLPDEVKRFYQQLDAGAPLTSLTKTVLGWLKEHNALKDLHIKRKGDNFWQDGQYRR